MPTDSLQIIVIGPEHRSAIRSILEPIGWAEQYITSSEQLASQYSADPHLALVNETPVGFIFIEHRDWNQLSQIQGLAVHPAYHRQGIARQLVEKAESFTRSKHARGIYVDTPVKNKGGRAFYEALGYQVGYIMPRYYEDGLDGVTYQKFFSTGQIAVD